MNFIVLLFQLIATVGIISTLIVFVIVLKALLNKEEDKYKQDYSEFIEQKRRVENKIKGNKFNGHKND